MVKRGAKATDTSTVGPPRMPRPGGREVALMMETETVTPTLGEEPSTGPRRQRLGELLVTAGVLTDAQVTEAVGRALPDERFGSVLMRIGFATEDDIADAVATQLRLPRIDVTYERPPAEAIDRLPSRLAERHEVLPLRLDHDGALVLATADPSDVVALDDVRMAAGVRAVRPVVTTSAALTVARRRAYRADATQDLLEGLAGAVEEEDDEVVDAEDAPVVRLVDSLLADAVAARASDLHVEAEPDGLRVRIRVDGMLRETAHVPRTLAGQVVSRLKILSRLDIAERRLPQDGRALLRFEDQAIDVRVSTMPTLFGETVVLRLLPKGSEQVAVDELGLQPLARERFLEALGRPQGLVLVTGPTGSGKTTTLYAGLSAVADPTRNVLTLEDPIEYQLSGVNQTQIEPKIGLTFARGLRHVLRQDPDVVLVGEIRDEETAQLAVEASFTGHLVLATLHTNDAPSSVSRLIDLGVDPFLASSSLLLVLAQRLARTICRSCAEPTPPPDDVLRRLGLDAAALEGASPQEGAGCPACEGTGELGRTAISELLPIGPRVRELLLETSSEVAIGRLARTDGMQTLRESAIELAREGTITFAEALRVTPEPSGEVTRCPTCTTVVADDHLVCPICATQLAVRHCQGCGRGVEDAWSTCPWCRHPLGRPVDSHPLGRPVDSHPLGRPVDSHPPAR
jgi:type IV pilus assembly protein PilB